jgi:hypothetical protein
MLTPTKRCYTLSQAQVAPWDDASICNQHTLNASRDCHPHPSAIPATCQRADLSSPHPTDMLTAGRPLRCSGLVVLS